MVSWAIISGLSMETAPVNTHAVVITLILNYRSDNVSGP